MEITLDNVRELHPAQLLDNIDEWVDFLMENRNEVDYGKTIGFWEMTVNFPKLPWVYGVRVVVDPWEHDIVADEHDHDYHKYLLVKIKDELKKSETHRLKEVANGCLSPTDWQDQGQAKEE